MRNRNDDELPQANVLLKGKLVSRCMKIRKTTGMPITAIVRTALLEWFAEHDGEPGVAKIKL